MIDNILPIREYILWDNCPNRCSFCIQNKEKNELSEIEQLNSIQKVRDDINSLSFPNSHVLIVGGEIFDTRSSVGTQLIKLFQDIIVQMKADRIGFLYINTSLTYSNIDMLCSFLKMIYANKMQNRLKFTTSYDVFGRFSVSTKKQFLKNMNIMSEYFNWLHIVVNTIMTKQFCTYVNNEFHDFSYVKSFQKQIKCSNVNLIPYINVNDELVPTSDQVMKVLITEYKHNSKWMSAYKANWNLKQKKIVLRYHDGVFVNRTSADEVCQHSKNFSKYSTAGSCFICDLNHLFEDV